MLWFAVVGCGMMAGIYFAFSTFIMTSLAKLPAAAGGAAMQSINRVILRSSFMILFFGTTLVSVGLVVIGIIRWGQPASLEMIIASDAYIFGMFLVTAAFNVPLNNALDAVDVNSDEAAVVWERYLRTWTRWNHLRTVASALSCCLFIYVILLRAQ